MEAKKMTIMEVLEITKTNLAAINVPVGLTQQIAEPIAKAIGNISACIEAAKAQENKETEEETTEE